MTLAWDYTAAATSYAKRAPYCEKVLDRALGEIARRGARACDVGAGTGNLTLALARRGFEVLAIEPNPAMRRIGRVRTACFPHVCWVAAAGETTGLAAESCALVCFGSSFNVVDAPRALEESARILAPGGWLVLVWNHRRLDDPLQARIEALLHHALPGFRYGRRREDQTRLLAASAHFARVRRIEGETVHRVSAQDFLAGWRSHLTLRRQAGERFEAILEEIRGLVSRLGQQCLDVPYTTRLWIAQKAAGPGYAQGLEPGRAGEPPASGDRPAARERPVAIG